jgi:hypothetical protein
VPGTISWSQPGHRYDFVVAAPDTGRTAHSPSGHVSVRSVTGTGVSAGAGRRVRRGLTTVHLIQPRLRMTVRLIADGATCGNAEWHLYATANQ